MFMYMRLNEPVHKILVLGTRCKDEQQRLMSLCIDNSLARADTADIQEKDSNKGSGQNF